MISRNLFFTAIAVAALAVQPVKAASVADFYKGKTITVFVGSAPGGGYDTNGRIFAKYVVKHIPGRPNSIVKNMPGAGSKRLLNYLYNVAAKDGTELGIFFSQAAMEPILLGQSGSDTKYETLKFNWIGSIDQFSPIAIAWHNSGIKSIEDAKKKELKVGTSGGGLTDSIYSRMLNNMIGTKFVLIGGYKGSRHTTMAMEQGEIPGYIGWYWAGLKRSKPHWLEKNLVTVFMQLGIEKNPDMGNIPWVFDVLEKPEHKQLFRLVLTNLGLARPFAAPPGVPADRVEALRSAFDATMKDPEFLAAMKKAGVNVNPRSGENIDKLLADVAKTPKELVNQLRKMVKE